MSARAASGLLSELQIAGQTVRSLLIFALDPAAAPAVDYLRQLPVTVTLSTDLGLADLAAPERAIAQLSQIHRQKHFDAAIIFSAPQQSPYQAAYLSYLAGIPIRVGQSQEFGGAVLSHCLPPPAADPHWALLRAVGWCLSAQAAPSPDVSVAPGNGP